jgi:hypothetical protein
VNISEGFKGESCVFFHERLKASFYTIENIATGISGDEPGLLSLVQDKGEEKKIPLPGLEPG